MYFKGVNRGVAFTKAGVYTTGLVILLGFFATGSGYNGLFLALGFGLSILVISGILSEKVMKNYECLGLTADRAEPNQPFSVVFRVRNRSQDWSLFGVENLALTNAPRFRLLADTSGALVECRLPELEPARTIEVAGLSRGLPRGYHEDLALMQRTLYPFGLLSKFKIDRLPTPLEVLPAWDAGFAAAFSLEVRRRFRAQEALAEFHSHRPYTVGDPARGIDWKKSAGLPPDSWSVKVHESSSTDFTVLVEVDWEAARLAASEADYEAYFSRIRTAIDTIVSLGGAVTLRTPRGVRPGRDASLGSLIHAPRYENRAKLEEALGGERLQTNRFLRLHLGPGSWAWEGEGGGR